MPLLWREATFFVIVLNCREMQAVTIWWGDFSNWNPFISRFANVSAVSFHSVLEGKFSSARCAGGLFGFVSCQGTLFSFVFYEAESSEYRWQNRWLGCSPGSISPLTINPARHSQKIHYPLHTQVSSPEHSHSGEMWLPHHQCVIPGLYHLLFGNIDGSRQDPGSPGVASTYNTKSGAMIFGACQFLLQIHLRF